MKTRYFCIASLIDWMLTVYGTKELPEEKKNHSTFVPEFNKLKGRLQQTAFTTTIDLDVKKDLESTAKTDEEEFPPALQLIDEQASETGITNHSASFLCYSFVLSRNSILFISM